MFKKTFPNNAGSFLLVKEDFDMNINEIQKIIGYNYKNIDLLKTALTHSSYANEKKLSNNERLEFLGDSVLSIIVSDYLYGKFQDINEGKLTQIRSNLVCEKSLGEIAKKISLGELIFLGHGEEISGGRQRPSVVSDAFEAVLASIYLDGGMENAQKWLLNLIEDDIEEAVSQKTNKDFKTRLQETVQTKGNFHTVTYKTVEESGEDHSKHFKVAVLIDNKIVEYGEGNSKKAAEQNAAQAALNKNETF